MSGHNGFRSAIPGGRKTHEMGFNWQAIARALVREADIREGKWRVAVRQTSSHIFVRADDGGDGAKPLYPTVMTHIVGLEIRRMRDDFEMDDCTVDASELWQQESADGKGLVLTDGPTTPQ